MLKLLGKKLAIHDAKHNDWLPTVGKCQGGKGFVRPKISLKRSKTRHIAGPAVLRRTSYVIKSNALRYAFNIAVGNIRKKNDASTDYNLPETTENFPMFSGGKH